MDQLEKLNKREMVSGEYKRREEMFKCYSQVNPCNAVADSCKIKEYGVPCGMYPAVIVDCDDMLRYTAKGYCGDKHRELGEQLKQCEASVVDVKLCRALKSWESKFYDGFKKLLENLCEEYGYDEVAESVKSKRMFSLSYLL